MGSFTRRLRKFAPALVRTGYFPESLSSPRETSCLHILSPLLAPWWDSWKAGMVPWETETLQQDRICMLLKRSLSGKEQSPSSNLKQISRELPICLCLKSKSPCVLCEPGTEAWEEGRTEDWCRGGRYTEDVLQNLVLSPGPASDPRSQWKVGCSPPEVGSCPWWGSLFVINGCPLPLTLNSSTHLEFCVINSV